MGVSSRALRGGAILLGVVFLLALRGVGLFGALVPPEAHGSQEILLVSALAFTATFCSFLLVTDEAVVFTCVWAIAIIGLTGTVEINRPLIVSFVFLFDFGDVFAYSSKLAHANNCHSANPAFECGKSNRRKCARVLVAAFANANRNGGRGLGDRFAARFLHLDSRANGRTRAVAGKYYPET